MISRTRLFAVAAVLLLGVTMGFTQIAAAQTGAPYLSAPHILYGEEILEARRMVRDYLDATGVPGFQISVGVGDQIVWSEGFGLADVEQLVPVTPLTRFQSGSIGKAQTATALALLWEQGKLDWDAPVQRYVPDFPEKEHEITIRQLAGHLAGLRHYRSFRDFIQYRRFATFREGLEEFENDPLIHEPGTTYSYSSYGYNLLGVVVERITGLEYMQAMKEYVFHPLGLFDTERMDWNTIIPHRARLYERPSMATPNSYKVGFAGPGHESHDRLINAPYTDISHKTPAGGFVTTTDNLARFTFAHFRPGLLKAETLTLLQTSMRTTSGEETGYGLGWNLRRDAQGRRTLSHGGGPVGATASLLAYPDNEVVVAIQTNITSAQLSGIIRAIALLFVVSAERG